MCVCFHVRKFLIDLVTLFTKPIPICARVNCNCFLCNSMAQAQIDMEMSGRKKSSENIKRKPTSSCRSKFRRMISYHNIPLTVRIQSQPLEEGLTTRVILEKDWCIYVGGPSGGDEARTHINIRRIAQDENYKQSTGVSLPLASVPLLIKGLETASAQY